MYIAPLRHAVIHLGAGGAPFRAEAVSVLGQAKLAAARGFLSRLVSDGILLRLDGDRLRPAKHFDRWAERETKTKPGGHRIISYRAVPSI